MATYEKQGDAAKRALSAAMSGKREMAPLYAAAAALMLALMTSVVSAAKGQPTVAAEPATISTLDDFSQTIGEVVEGAAKQAALQ